MTLKYEVLVARNAGLIDKQTVLKNATVAVAGCGGAGGGAAVSLARMGVGALRLADPGDFEETNLNRQWGSSSSSIGMNKARVIEKLVRDVNPLCATEVYAQGIDADSVQQFCAGADVAIEAIDYWSAVPTVMLHRECRGRGVPVLTAVPVGWRSNLLLFEPDSMPFEEYIGGDCRAPLESFGEGPYPLHAYCPEPPDYVAPALVAQVAAGECDIPVVAPAVDATAAMLAAFTYFRLSGARELKPAPYFYSSSDMMTMEPRRFRAFRLVRTQCPIT